MARLDPARTTVCATLSALAWTALIAYGGYQLGENWTIIGSYLRAYGTVITVVGVTATAIIATRYYLRWRRTVRTRRDERSAAPASKESREPGSVDSDKRQP
jgi:membrane protein DedA with SNARE-associated domain